MSNSDVDAPKNSDASAADSEPQPSGEMGDREVRAVDGRVPGRRGQATRTRLLECTEALARTTSLRDLTVVDIAREAGTSPATFYQYFADVEAALIELGEELATRGSAELLAPLADLADSADRWQVALELADNFLRFFAENSHLLRVIDLAVLEGDQRFLAVRSHLLGPVTSALAEAAGPAAAKPGASQANAGVAVAMLAHVAAHRASFDTVGYGDDEVREALARNLHTAVLAARAS